MAVEGAPAQPQSNPLAEAEAALQQAEQAKTNDDQALFRAQNQMNDLSQKLKQSQSCFSQAQSGPTKAGALMQSCGQLAVLVDARRFFGRREKLCSRLNDSCG